MKKTEISTKEGDKILIANGKILKWNANSKKSKKKKESTMEGKEIIMKDKKDNMIDQSKYKNKDKAKEML